MEPSQQEPPQLPMPLPLAPTGPLAVHPDEKNLAMWCHLIPIIAGFLSGGFLGFLGPLIILNSNRKPSIFVDLHAKQSLNFQISMLIYGAALFVLGIVVGIVTFGIGFIILFPILFLLLIAVLVFEILATVAATNGKHYHYPLTIQFVK